MILSGCFGHNTLGFLVGYESHDRAAPGGAAAPKITAPDIYFSLLEAQKCIIPNFFAISTANSIINNCQ